MSHTPHSEILELIHTPNDLARLQQIHLAGELLYTAVTRASQQVILGLTMTSTLTYFSQPLDFEEISLVLDQLKQGSSCLVDLNGFSPELAQRAVDLLAGACHMLNGHCQHLAEGIFLFSFSSLSEQVA